MRGKAARNPVKNFVITNLVLCDGLDRGLGLESVDLESAAMRATNIEFAAVCESLADEDAYRSFLRVRLSHWVKSSALACRPAFMKSGSS